LQAAWGADHVDCITECDKENKIKTHNT
jgi:hypothetical protein